jgi:ribonucleoside-diphosphate reductase alpha chain
MKATNKTNIEESPYWNSTSAEIDWVNSVEMQARAQKWIDHSISKTCNLPSTATKEIVSDVLMAAYNSGCKGFTVYRDGSRTGVLVASDSKTNSFEFNEHHAPKRPKELICDIYHSTVQGEKWTIFVGLLNNKPYEVMGGLAKYVGIPKRVKQGKIVKINGDVNPARYDLIYDFESGNPDDETVIQDLGNVFENPLNSAFSRTLSLALRHGTPVQYVVEQLIKGSDKESDMFSFSKVVSRVLKNYIEDGTKTTQKKCSECGGTDLAFQEGCIRCLNPSCGHSKCG